MVCTASPTGERHPELSLVHPSCQPFDDGGRYQVNVRNFCLQVVVEVFDLPPVAAVALVAAADADNPVAAPRRTHVARVGQRNGERPSGANAAHTWPRVRLSDAIQALGARRTAPRAGQRKGKRRIGGWRETRIAQGVVQENGNPGGYNEKVKGEKNAVRPAATCWAADSRENCVATVSVRSIA